jgi:hypothetical protein
VAVTVASFAIASSTSTRYQYDARLQGHPVKAQLWHTRHATLHRLLHLLHPLVSSPSLLSLQSNMLIRPRRILITFSAPFIRTIYFLRASSTNFGAFGFAQPTTGLTSTSALGYEYGTQVLSSLTSAMILWGILDVFLFFQLMGVIPLLWVHDSAALHAVANSTFFTYSSVSLPPLQGFRMIPYGSR